MAEKRQIGIPDEPLDYTSDFITKPYELDNVKKYEDQKHEVLSGEIKRTVVGENWKIPTESQERRPQVVQALEGLERGVGDIIKGFFPQEQIKWRTDPVGAALGWLTAIKMPVVVGGAALLEGAESMFPETFGALKPKESKELTRDKLEQVWEDTLQKESQKLEQARTDLESGKISQVQYDAMEKQFDTLVSRRQKAFENLDKYNATVQALDGTPYPNAKVADTVVSESARYLQMRELNNAIEMAQKGIDPESTGFKIGSLAGPTAVLGAIGFGGNYLSRYGLSGALRRITTDVETEGGAARLAAIKPVRSRRQAARAGMAAVEVGTEEMESAQYVWQNVQDYIERTGDKTLENFTPNDAQAFTASAYGAIAGKIETMGGIENIAAGAFRRLGVGGFGRRVLITTGEEGLEEGAQKLSEYLARRIDGTTDKTIGEALEEALNAAAWGSFMGIGFGTIGGVTYRNARKQGIKVLQDYGLSRETAEKVFDNMIEQTTDSISPRNEPARENIRKKVSLIYEGADMSPAELEDTIEATTDLEMAMIAYDAANRGIDINEHPLLNSTVNNIGWFRDGIPEQVADQVEDLDNEIGNLRRQLAEENAKEKPDMDKIDDLEAKIEQFYAKLPKEVSDLVETDRQKVRQMLGEQSAQLQARQAQRRIVQQVQKRATSALQREQESDVKKSLRRLEQETKTEEKKAKEAERQQRTQQRKLRKAIEKLRQNMIKRKNNLPLSQELFADADLVYQALRDSGFSDQQIATMAEEDIVKAVAPYGISPVAKQMAEQFDLANENARLDEIYPEYTGETIVVDGKERPVYNSEGKRINKSAEALTNFWRWFGDSKVVDEQGRPLVVYHGGKKGIKSFSNRYAAEKNMFFFTNNRGIAEDYRGYNNKNIEDTMVYSMYLKITNPLVLRNENDLETFSKIMHPDNETLRQEWLDIQQAKLKEWVKDFDISYWFGQETIRNRDKIKEFADKNGYDGIFNYEPDTRGGFSKNSLGFIAFKPTQIKSTENSGAFSSSTGNIYYQDDPFSVAEENARLDDIYPAYDGETIEVDGKERTVYNSNGDRIAKSKEALTNFWRWFGDSKVVDEQGRPLVVYHLTPSTFDKFNLPKLTLGYNTYGSGIYTTTNQKYTSYGNKPDWNLMSLYVKAEHPADADHILTLQEVQSHKDKIVEYGGQELYDRLESVASRYEKRNDKTNFFALDDELKLKLSYVLNSIEREYRSGNDNENTSPFLDIFPEYDSIVAHLTSDEGDFEYYVAFEPTQIKSVDNRGTFSSETPNIYWQRVNQSKKRGFYSPELRLVSLLQAADPSSLSHELAHDWMQQFFRWYRSGKASESFMQSWGALEKALGISPDDINVPEKASEAFARAYEAWVMTKTDWEKGIDIDDENRDKIIELFKRYQGYLTDIYEDLNNPYFLETWGETGKLKPELQAWFDKVTIPTDLISAQVATGAITPEEAQTKAITRTVNQVVQAAEDNFTQKEKDEINAVERLNDTKRYEVEGGNKNSLQNRLSGLARDIDANNIALGRYDTHRDMLAVAQAADEFVRTRRDEALNIINGLEPEKEGLYASDLYTALERVAMETNDVDLAMDLVNSKVAKDLAKEWGQRVAGFRNFTGDGEFDAISQIKSLDNKYKKDYDEKGKERVKSASDEFVKDLDKTDSEQDLDSFFDSVKCQ